LEKIPLIYLKKKFDFDPVQFKTIRKGQNGVTVETGAVNVAADKEKSAYLRGYTKFALNRLSWGTGEAELHTDSKQASKVSTKFTKLFAFPLTLQATLATSDKHKYFADDKENKDKPIATVEGTYNQDHVHGQVTVKSNTANHRVEGQVSLGWDAYSFGGILALNSNSLHEVQANDIQFGGEYSQDDLTVSLYTAVEKDKDNNDQEYSGYTGSYFHRVNRDLVVGGQVKAKDLQLKDASLTFGGDYRLDVDTSVRGKVNVPKGVLSLAVEHRLPNPQLLLGLAGEFNVKNPAAPSASKFGLSFTLGDF